MLPPHQLDWWAEATFGSGEKAHKGGMRPELFDLVMEQGLAFRFKGDAKSQVQGKLSLRLLKW